MGAWNAPATIKALCNHHHLFAGLGEGEQNSLLVELGQGKYYSLLVGLGVEEWGRVGAGDMEHMGLF